MRLKPSDRYLVVGLTGSGKTYYVNHEILPDHPTAAVWTPHRNFDAGFYRDVSAVPPDARRWGIATRFDSRKAVCASFLAFANHAMETGASLIIVDEVVLLVEFGAESPLIMLATQARNYGCALVTISQRAYNVPLTVRSQSSRVVSFQQTDMHDIVALQTMAGNPSAFVPEKMRALKVGQHIDAQIRG